MPQAIPVPLRQAIVRRRQEGQSLTSIAQEFQIPWSTIRKFWRRVRDRGPDAVLPDYRRCSRPGPRSDARLIRAACWLKRHHPTWGAVFIGFQLQQKWPDRPLPPERTLQRWFRRAGVNRTPMRRPPQDRRRGMAPHEVWQVDAVEKQRLANGHQASWLTVTDEASGAILATELSPPRAMAGDRAGGRAGDAAADVPAVGAAGSPAGG